jgi:hypothetical protein
MSTFDAPSREACTCRRERTNTPLQALLLMNDPQYVEAARHFAERIIIDGPQSPSDRMGWAFERITMRPPSEVELRELLSAHSDFEAAYRNDAEAARKLIATGETPADGSLDPADLATWTMVANVILNLDEVITKE